MGFIGGCLAIIVVILVVITLILMSIGLPMFDTVYSVDCTTSRSVRECEELVEDFKEDTLTWRTLSGTCLIFAMIFDIVAGCAMCAPIEKLMAKKIGLVATIIASILCLLCILFNIPAYNYEQIGFAFGSALIVLAAIILVVQAIILSVMVCVTNDDDDKSKRRSRGPQYGTPGNRQQGRDYR